jgi:ketosteroid isomerase-like protein
MGMDGAELMRRVVAAFGNSDLQPLLDAIHEDIVWKTASKHEGVFRFDGQYKNRPGVLDVLSKISQDYTFHYLRPKEILAVADVVWGLFDASVSYDPKGKIGAAKALSLEMAIRWRLKDGKIIEHQGFFDTASVLIQQGMIPDPGLQS